MHLVGILFHLLALSFSHSNANLIDNHHQVFDSAGVAVEQTGFIYTYSTFIYEKIHFSIPLNLNISVSVCREEQQKEFEQTINKIYNNAIQTLKNRVDEYNADFFNLRQKRFALVPIAAALTAAGIMSVGISIYNTYQVNSISAEIKKLQEENLIIRENQILESHKLNEVISKINEFSTIIIPN